MKHDDALLKLSTNLNATMLTALSLDACLESSGVSRQTKKFTEQVRRQIREVSQQVDHTLGRIEVIKAKYKGDDDENPLLEKPAKKKRGKVTKLNPRKTAPRERVTRTAKKKTTKIT